MFHSLRRLALIFAGISVLSAVVTAGLVIWATLASDTVIRDYKTRAEVVDDFAQLTFANRDLSLLAGAYVVTGQPARRQAYRAKAPARFVPPLNRDILHVSAQNLRDSGLLTAGDLARLDQAIADADPLRVAEMGAIALATAYPRYARAAAAMLESDHYLGIFDQVEAELHAIETDVLGRIDAHAAGQALRAHLAEYAAIASSVIAIAAALASSAVVLRGVVAPLLRLAQTMRQLGEGEYVEVPGVESQNEIGEMARRTEMFRDKSLEAVRLSEEVQRRAQETMALAEREKAHMAEALREREQAAAFQREIARVVEQAKLGDFAARLDLDDSYAVGMRIGTGLNDMFDSLEEAFGQIAAALGLLAAGDLSVPVDARQPGLPGEVLADAERARSKLSALVAETRNGATEVFDLVRDISSGSNDLSQRTEATAATLEQSSAALTELSASVASAADGAGHADEIVTRTRGRVDEGDKLVADAVTAMGRIETSSQKIGKIIDVIEDIAFQTNLLALNAGVEAARAGEAGRGFAVVASEVRALAQRSSEAAREINDLIQASGEEVSRGARLVHSTGAMLREIVESVGEISGHVSAIAASAREQSTGISEISVAVTQLDEATQNNAALVAQTGSATHSLGRLVDDLRATVGRFRLDAEQDKFGQGGGRSVA